MRSSNDRRTNQCGSIRLSKCCAFRMFTLLGGVIVLLALFSGSSLAGLANQNCLKPDTDFDNCTANDVGLASMKVLAVKKGCVSTSDSAIINMQVTFNAANPTRYDLGLYLATDGGNAITNATTGIGGCFKEALFPVLPKDTVPDEAQQTSGIGSYLNRDGDSCGDVEKSLSYVRKLVNGDISSGSIAAADITIQCSDTVGTGGSGPPNGYMDIGWVASWDENERSVCGSVLDAKPGTTAKCRSGYIDTAGTGNPIPIGVPNLGLTKTCSPITVAPGGFVDCTITYTNSSALGPADNIEFRDAPFIAEGGGTIPGTYSLITPSTGYVDMSSGLPAWRPNTTSPNPPGIANIKGGSEPSHTGTLTYRFTVASPPPTIPVGSYTSTVTAWYNNGRYASPENLSASATVNLANPTLVQLGDFKATGNDSGITLAWKTHVELNNAGFSLWRAKAPAASPYRRIRPDFFPAEGSVFHGASYKYDDTGLTSGSTYFYKLEDIDTSGISTFHGPAVATVGGIDLIEPSTGTKLLAAHPASFSWEATGYDRFIVQFSKTHDFSSISLQYPTSANSGKSVGKKRWLLQTDWTPKSAQWKRIKAAALATRKKAIYWRVYAENRFGARFTSEPNVLSLVP